MATFDSCPPEMVHEVFTYLSTSDWLNLCHVNHYFRNVAQPFLFRRINLTLNPHGRIPIDSLASTLFRRPDLGQHVARLTLQDSYDQLLVESLCYKPPSKIQLNIERGRLEEIATGINALGLPYGNLWIQQLGQGTMDAYVALIVAQLPNLVSLSLKGGAAKETQILGNMLTSALCGGDPRFPKFPRLSKVKLLPPRHDPHHGSPPANLPTILPLFYLPALQKLSVKVNERASVLEWPGPPPRCETLESLSVITTAAGPLRPLLETTPRLKSLCWGAVYDECSPAYYLGRDTMIDLDKLTAALSAVQGTLESLSLSALCSGSRTQDDDGPERRVWTLWGILGSLAGLKDCRNLRSLDLPLAYIRDPGPTAAVEFASNLPETVSSLTVSMDLQLADDFAWDDARLVNAAGWWMQNLRLQRFTLVQSGGMWGEYMEDLHALCEDAGVEFKWRIWNVDGMLRPKFIHAKKEPWGWTYS